MTHPKIIVVDDVEIIRQGVRAQIIQTGLPVKVVGEAESGEEALKLIHETGPDIVLTDIRMARMDGMKLIAKSVRLNPNIKFIIVTGYPEFQYAKEAIRLGVVDFLLKPLKTSELKQILEKTIDLISIRRKQLKYETEEQFLSFLYGSAGKPEHLPFPAIRASYKIVCFRLFEYVQDSSLGERDMLEHDIGGRLAEVEGVWFCKKRGRDGHYWIVLWSSDPGSLEETSRAIVQDLLKLTRRYIHRVLMSISAAFHDIEDLPKSRIETAALIDQRWIDHDEIVFYPAPASKTAIEAPPAAEFESLRSFLSAQQFDSAKNLISGWFRNSDLRTGTYFRRLYIRILLLFWEIGSLKGNGRESAADFPYQEAEAKLNRFAALRNMEEELMARIDAARSASAGNAEDAPDLIKQIRSHIQQNIHQDITRDEISSHFGIHPNYLSNLFRERTGSTLMDTIHRMKIEAALKILNQSDYPIGTVAGMVGMEHSYFCRLFKRVTGTSPVRYRNSN